MPSSEQRSITLRGKTIDYVLKQSKRSKRVRISVSESGVSLTLPYGYPPRDGESFLTRNADWVLEQLEKHNRRAARAQHNTLPADVVLLRGVPTQVVIFEESARRSRPRVDEEKGKLVLRIPTHAREIVPAALENHLRGLARQQIEETVSIQSMRMGLKPRSVTIRDQRTRWGSCSSTGTLSFNWRLIMVPPTVMEYVVIHELAHMAQPNHSPAFWAIVSRYYPSFKEARSWLRKNAALLHPSILTEF